MRFNIFANGDFQGQVGDDNVAEALKIIEGWVRRANTYYRHETNGVSVKWEYALVSL